MWVGTINSNHFFSANRWTVAYFNNTDVSLAAGFPMRKIRDLAVERKSSTDPQQLGKIEVSYLGLENVRPLTGELVDFAPRLASAIKSRSKVFHRGDVLYGRLRPELNKVFLAEGSVQDGLCSGEFIVLMPNSKIVFSRFLRHVLSSRYVTQFATMFKVGASLPRMGVEDLLDISIPVPPLQIQEDLVKRLEMLDLEIAETRKKVEELPTRTAAAMLEFLQNGGGKFDAN
jgi:hypothetical protein